MFTRDTSKLQLGRHCDGMMPATRFQMIADKAVAYENQALKIPCHSCTPSLGSCDAQMFTTLFAGCG